jgi:hypothetical protein
LLQPVHARIIASAPLAGYVRPLTPK